MSSGVVFHSFEFKPNQLTKVADELKHKYKDGRKHLLEDINGDTLPHLIEEIKSLPYNRKAISKYAHGLRSKNVRLLAFLYPYNQEEKTETIKKVFLILSERYQSFIGEIMWRHFQNMPNDPVIVNLLKIAFKSENDDFLSFEKQLRKQMNGAFEQYNVLQAMVTFLPQHQKTLDELMQAMDISLESRLAQYLWYISLKQNIDKNRFTVKEGELKVSEKLDGLTIKNYKEVMVNYLTNVAVNDFNRLFLEQVIEKLKDPRKNDTDWKDMPKVCAEKVKQWLIRNELKQFFAEDTKYDRFRYWERHTKNIKDVDFIQDPMLAIMDFGEFVVVEFAETGNAAYFYHKQAFYEKMYIRVKYGRLSPNQIKLHLKNRDADYYIHKANHFPVKPEPPGWHRIFDGYMRAYMQENFRYRHI